MRRLARYSICLMGLIALATCGCHTAKMPSPVVFHDGRVDPCARIPESERTTTVQLFYATSRRATGTPSSPSYSNDMSNDLRGGVAPLQLGREGTTWEQHCAASTGKTSVTEPKLSIKEMRELARLSKPSDKPPPAAFTADELAWADAINRQLDRTPNKQVNIYIHGCNTDLGPELL